MMQANIFSSLCSIMIVILKLVTCKVVTKYEIIGSIIGILGCIVISFDYQAEKTDPENSQIPFGNLLCSFSSVFGTLYILKGQELSLKVQSLPYLMSLTAITCLIFFTVFPIAYWESDFTLSMDLQTGIFGWLSPQNAFYNIIVVSGLNGVGSLALQMMVFRLFTPIIAGAEMLIEPAFGQIYGIALGLDKFPGINTYIGGTLTFAGLFILLKYEKQISQ